MIEIKFRCFNKTDKRWEYFVIQPNDENMMSYTLSFGSNIHIYLMEKGFLDNSTWGHSIGLKDKNKKDIYAGDILKTDSGNKKVIYSAPSFDLEDYDNGDYYDGQNPYSHGWDRFEVIGNIYENPELLKEPS